MTLPYAVYLFDIDGTLVSAGGAGVARPHRALDETIVRRRSPDGGSPHGGHPRGLPETSPTPRLPNWDLKQSRPGIATSSGPAKRSKASSPLQRHF